MMRVVDIQFFEKGKGEMQHPHTPSQMLLNAHLAFLSMDKKSHNGGKNTAIKLSQLDKKCNWIQCQSWHVDQFQSITL